MRISALVLAFVLGAALPASAQPAPAATEAPPAATASPAPAQSGAPLERPATPLRRAAQVLAVGALVLAAGGAIAFGISLADYRTVRDGCGATVAGCTSDQVAPGKLADGLGWAGIGGGIVLGAVAVAIAIADTRRETRRVAFGFGPGSFALVTYF